MVGRFLKFAKYMRAQHFWRKATFSEISALYIAKVLRLLALNLVSAFILVYLYQSGYPLLYLAIFSAYRALMAVIVTPLASMLTSQFGAKKIIMLGNILFIPAIIFYTDLTSDLAIILGGSIQSIAVTLYQVAHDVVFSEVKSEENAGREIGYMAIFEKITNVLSPLLGGILAALVSPNFVILIASFLFVISTWPLLRSQGTAKKHHAFRIEAVPFRVYAREMICQITPGFDSTVEKIWPLFLVIFIFSQQNAFLVTGIANAAAGLVAVLAAFWVGKILDRGRRFGLKVFNLSVVLGSISHLTKALVATPILAIANIILSGSTNVLKDVSSLRAQFYRADNSGSRVVYLMYRHLFWNVFTFIACLVWSGLMFYGDPQANLSTFFIIAAVASLTYSFSGYWKYHN